MRTTEFAFGRPTVRGGFGSGSANGELSVGAAMEHGELVFVARTERDNNGDRRIPSFAIPYSGPLIVPHSSGQMVVQRSTAPMKHAKVYVEPRSMGEKITARNDKNKWTGACSVFALRPRQLPGLTI